MHNCPRCGQRTSGAWSEGGLRWAICDHCTRRERSCDSEHTEPRRERGEALRSARHVAELEERLKDLLAVAEGCLGYFDYMRAQPCAVA